MQAIQLLLPAVASLTLGVALLVPLRDERRGRRATLAGRATTMSPDFGALQRGQPLSDSAPQGDVQRPPCNIATEGSAPATDGTTTATGLSGLVIELKADAASSNADRRPLLPELWRAIRGLVSAESHTLALDGAANGPHDERDAHDERDERNERDEHETVVERSFAGELQALLAAPRADDLAGGLCIAQDPSSESASEPCRQDVPPPGAYDLATAADVRRPVRIAPLTRHPLRVRRRDIAWTSQLDPPLENNLPARTGFLERAARIRMPALEPILVAAYHEENAANRLLVLRALLGARSNAAVEAFRDALSSGTDDERALAVDAIVASGHRELLTAALTDRVDAIAARAALAYVDSAARQDYKVALASYLDEHRIESILALLAGVVS
jgi:hypothetical protein